MKIKLINDNNSFIFSIKAPKMRTISSHKPRRSYDKLKLKSNNFNDKKILSTGKMIMFRKIAGF